MHHFRFVLPSSDFLENDNVLSGFSVRYAYERLLGEQNLSTYTFHNNPTAWDASYHELCEAAGAEMVLRSDWNFNSAVLQIITWRIAQGSFNPNNMAYEKALAKYVYDQMYPSDIWGDAYSTRVQYFYEYYMKCAIESASGNYAQKYGTVKVKYWAVQGDDSANWQDFITWDAGNHVPSIDDFKVTKYGKLITASIKYPNATFDIYSDSARTHQIGVFTTDANGEATINLVQGVYYLKEITAPTGMILDDKLITLNVTGKTVSAEHDAVGFFRIGTAGNDCCLSFEYNIVVRQRALGGKHLFPPFIYLRHL